MLGGPLIGSWPYAYQGVGQPGGTMAGPAGEPFRVLTTCSWEQNDTMVKVYVPLRGVQTDMLRATFHLNSLEVRGCALSCAALGPPTSLPPFCPKAQRLSVYFLDTSLDSPTSISTVFMGAGDVSLNCVHGCG